MLVCAAGLFLLVFASFGRCGCSLVLAGVGCVFAVLIYIYPVCKCWSVLVGMCCFWWVSSPCGRIRLAVGWLVVGVWLWLVLVGLGWSWLVLVGVGWCWLGLVRCWFVFVGFGCACFWLVLVGYGWFLLVSVGMGCFVVGVCLIWVGGCVWLVSLNFDWVKLCLVCLVGSGWCWLVLVVCGWR